MCVQVQQNIAESGQLHSNFQLMSFLMKSFIETGKNFGFILGMEHYDWKG